MKRKQFVEFAKKVSQLAAIYGVRGEWDHSEAGGYYFFDTDVAEPEYKAVNEEDLIFDYDYLEGK